MSANDVPQYLSFLYLSNEPRGTYRIVDSQSIILASVYGGVLFLI